MSSPPPAGIRPYRPADEKQVRFMVGQAAMESLAFANNRAYFHPFTLALWIAMSAVFTQYMNVWPDPSHGYLGYLQWLPTFFAPAVPIMFAIDWINRPHIETHAENVLHRVDLLDIASYYARSPASSLWILEYSKKIIGLLAMDASTDARNDTPPTTKLTAAQQRQVLHGKGTSSVATIRHMFVEQEFKNIGVEDDLLEFAVRSVFEASREVQTIRTLASPLRPTVMGAIRKAGFVQGEAVEKWSVLREPLSWWTLERSKWENLDGGK